MEKQRKFNKRYCIAFGCLNNNKKIPDLTLFTLPKEPERRRAWLTVIDREDLAEINDFKYKSYEVCIAHFDDSDIKTVKHLKTNAIPIRGSDPLSTPSNSSSDLKMENNKCGIKPEISIMSTVITNSPKTISTGTQTEPKTCIGRTTQTTKELLERTSRKRALVGKFMELKPKRKCVNKEFNHINKELEKPNALVKYHTIPRVPLQESQTCID